MSILIEPLSEPVADRATATETLADLLTRLGDISPNRIRLRPAPGTATEADVIRIKATEKRLFELVDGVLVEKSMGFRESWLAVFIAGLLASWITPRNLGIVVGADAMMRLFPGQVRMPDVAFVSWSRLPGGCLPTEPIPQLAPDLAIEVLSESNTKREMSRKREEYFSAGVMLVWIIDPKIASVSVFTSPEQSKTLSNDDILDGGDVLPGFTISLRQLFTEPKANPST